MATRTKKEIPGFEAYQVGTNINHYLQRIDLQLQLLGITSQEKRCAYLLTSIGAQPFEDLANQVEDVNELSFQDLCSKLKELYGKRTFVLVERYKFMQRVQEEGESIEAFGAALVRLSSTCLYKEALDDMLRDKFIFGLRNKTIQEKLLCLQTTGLSFKDVLAKSVALETANATCRTRIENFSIRKVKGRCFRCGNHSHHAHQCTEKNLYCEACHLKGHVEVVCKRKHRIKFAEDETEECISKVVDVRKTEDIFWVTCVVAGVPIKFELDTGSSVSLVSEDVYNQKLHFCRLSSSNVVMRTVTGEKFSPLGTVQVEVKVNGTSKLLKLYVLKGKSPCLFGRDWLKEFDVLPTLLTSKKTNSVDVYDCSMKINNILENYKDVFSPELGKMKGVKATLHLKDQAKPKFVKPRPVTYALKQKVEDELEQLLKNGIIEPVKYSEWAAPIVPIQKKNGKMRICGDYKIGLNPNLENDVYTIPRIEDIFAELEGGRLFSKIDLANAYLQLELDDFSKALTTINTHKGLFRYNRMVFGLKPAPSIFQRTIDQVLQGIPGVKCYLDDILITGVTDDAHEENLRLVLQRLRDFGLRANKDKSFFFQNSLEYCGHIIDANGLHKCPDKVEALLKAPRPTTVHEVRSYLGFLNYYQRFIPGLSTVIHPLNKLLEKNKKFKWTADCEEAFKRSKELAASDSVLTHYNSKLPIILATDASPVGISAVISHRFNNNEERPISFASRSLTNIEQKYSQIDKEALAIVWGVRKFEHYLIGRHFILQTDNKPLTFIFHPEKSISATTSSRLQRYALYLAGLDYKVEFRPTKQHSNADGLSRMPLPLHHCDTQDGQVFQSDTVNEYFDCLPVTAKQISEMNDQFLEKIKGYVLNNKWEKDDTHPDFKKMYCRRNELTLHSDCLMWGNRVVIPSELRSKILKELHMGHPGVVKMKGLARSYLWWPSLDDDIEALSRNCEGCRHTQADPPSQVLHSWESPAVPWHRVHIDFAGPFQGFMFLVVVDAYSKWAEVIKMKNATSATTITHLRSTFARTGLPVELVSDGATVFTSAEFKRFLESNGIHHIVTPPYHPQSNGQAERCVRTFKDAMRAAEFDQGDLQVKLDKFLLRYRTTPHSKLHCSPAEIFMGRRLRTRLDLLKPNERSRNNAMEARTKQFRPGDEVWVKDFRARHPTWKKGVIQSRVGTSIYDILVEGLKWRRHCDHLSPRGGRAVMYDCNRS